MVRGRGRLGENQDSQVKVEISKVSDKEGGLKTKPFHINFLTVLTVVTLLTYLLICFLKDAGAGSLSFPEV